MFSIVKLVYNYCIQNASWCCCSIITARKRSLRRLCFYTCLSFSPQAGYAWWGRGRRACVGACVAGWRGQCVNTWQGVCVMGACMMEDGGVSGRRGREHAWGHTWYTLPGRYYEIRPMSGRYASYWNAFLFELKLWNTRYNLTTVNFLLFNNFHFSIVRCSGTTVARFLFVPFARVGSGDPVRVLRLLHNKYAGYNWSIYCWDICTTCRYRNYVLRYCWMCTGQDLTKNDSLHCTVRCLI